ncbi:DUF971 domain-containing protein [Aurantimonas sp. C2-6-R+9]|uniref:DUF971 domain-containing protein n=1 Tax=unclassified Aurantimonas TaxID=2638230 RepID=UPI002E1721D4|nr:MULTISPECIES: DUF971 domain-containing protein [unclassified Aurantimonas]MEC5291681.1 DUF971 domain-containing protein [Aurantimonas sp. C2-3-R2]MEC5381863.1 DUF971 domain-containing protein [Aurantimonas sp. C2-6-R+9]MEC5412765.1 DUF971 domain-containing protein [Aurantimonas sp. C2-4-R8]
MTTATTTPEQIRVTPDRRTLIVVVPGGERIELPAEMLRVMSPSAEVQGHSPSQRQTVGGKIAVQIMDIQPVGNYAIRIMFDDMHSSGIFTWTYLADLGREKEERWQVYLDELQAKGLKRER